MTVTDKQILDNLIEEEDARRHAAFHIHLGVSTNTPGMTTWYGASLGDAIAVHDLNDLPLFYVFPVLSPRQEQIGLVRTAASRVLGVPVVDIFLGGPNWTPGRATLQAREYVENKLRGKVIESKVVCYAYPRTGIDVKWKKAGESTERRTIFDLFDLTEVRGKAEKDVRGAGMFSIYENLSKKMVPKALKRFSPYDQIIKDIKKNVKKDLSKSLDMQAFQKVQTYIQNFTRVYQSKVLPCFNLYPQIDPYYCTEATVQMLLDWWRYYHDQNAIRSTMTGSSGNDYQKEIATLENLSLGHLSSEWVDVPHDSDPSLYFDKVKKEIDAKQPFDYSYFGHSTACAGYSTLTFHLPTSRNIQIRRVYLYDPYPENQGNICWSTYDTPWKHPIAGKLPLAAFVFLRRNLPSP